jgi:hypothetical protein
MRVARGSSSALELPMDVHAASLAAALQEESRRRAGWRRLLSRFLSAVGLL